MRRLKGALAARGFGEMLVIARIGVLAAAVSEGRIAGAGLDVFEAESIGADHPLMGLENVAPSPHAAWYSEESEVEIRTGMAQNVVDVLSGGEPTYLAKPEVREVLKDRA